MHLHIFSFVECGHRMSKHVDGHNSDRWDNSGLRYTICPIAVASENDNKMLQWQYIVLIKHSNVTKKYNNDVVILVALI